MAVPTSADGSGLSPHLLQEFPLHLSGKLLGSIPLYALQFFYNDRLSIFANPDNMIFYIIHTMRRFCVIPHIFTSGLVSLVFFFLPPKNMGLA